MGTSVGVYSNWARKAKAPIAIDELEDGGKLLWIGPKRTEKVLLYCHGGGYVVPVQEFTIPFWKYIQFELEKQGIKVGIAIMSYSLIPVGQFPAPLWQASRAIQHLLTTENVKPSNLQLVGDSAGGNLIAQILSSMLHPLFSPPIIPPGIRLRGAYMMSPWISMTGVGSHVEKGIVPSFNANDHSDVVGAKVLLSFGSIVLASAKTSSDAMYIEPIHAPSEWYRGLSDVVDRVFISTGGAECLRDHGRMFFEDKIKPWHAQAEYFEMEGGVHNDPYFDFQVADGPLGERQTLTPKILDWVKKGFEEN
ncbi:alpha/beta-hydrolase [Gymnopus androsaceus JB14]|uniref:Alpha/beta-hydrolase n=1 Tax=Gymnopus androsaceus JB14 TaxID=1447944 RepID=A0A6A4HU96_9AGAR|nr:alpha/beta-hydrolase [Gymnopus androsaceus JB14]